MNNYVFEICANSAESAVQAQLGGAQRVELCAGIPEGGTTPSFGEIMTALKYTNIDINVIIRPRAGDFLYTERELEIMECDIELIRETGIRGVVFGCLTADGDVDTVAMTRLMKHCKGLSVTFHRAFDVCRNPQLALEQIIDLGCNRILTSGQQPDAQQGIPLIQKLVEQAGKRIIIMPGCGINETNIKEIASKTGAKEFHMSARSLYPSSMIYKNPRVSMGGTVVIDEYKQSVTDAEKVKRTFSILNN